MNPNQLATFEEAVAIKHKLGSMGGGVVNIYVPAYSGPFSAHKDFLHFDFANGATGLNVGLIRETIRRNPYTWPSMMAADINGAARKPED